MTTSPISLGRFQSNFIEMFPRWPYTYYDFDPSKNIAVRACGLLLLRTFIKSSLKLLIIIQNDLAEMVTRWPSTKLIWTWKCRQGVWAIPSRYLYKKLYQHFVFIYGPRRKKTCLRGFVNNKGADQPAHPRRLISAFVFGLLESIISRVAMCEISIF